MLSAPVALATSWTRVSNHRSTSPQGGPGGGGVPATLSNPSSHPVHSQPGFRGSCSLLTQCVNGSRGGGHGFQGWRTRGLTLSLWWVPYVLVSFACEFCPHTPPAHPKQGLISSCHKWANIERGQSPSCIYLPPFYRRPAKWGEPGFWSWCIWVGVQL